MNRISVYKNISNSKMISAKAMTNISSSEANLAKIKLERMRVLYKKHYISESEWEADIANYNKAQENKKNMQAKEHMEGESLESIKNGMVFTGDKVEGTLGEIKAQIQSAEQKIKLFQDRVNVYEAILTRLIIKAPFDGKVIEVLKSAGSTIDNMKPILILEQTNAKHEVIAFLTQSEILQVDVKRPVKIYIPSTGSIYNGKVESIDRTAGFIDEIKAQYRWRNLDIDRSATVKVSINKEEETRFADTIEAGVPVIAYFSKRLNLF